MRAAPSSKRKPARKPPVGSPSTFTDDPASSAVRLSDAQIAADAMRRLAWDAAVPAHSVKVHVSRGRLTLTGELKRAQQRAAALEDVTRLFGVTGVSDRTVVKESKDSKEPGGESDDASDEAPGEPKAK